MSEVTVKRRIETEVGADAADMGGGAATSATTELDQAEHEEQAIAELKRRAALRRPVPKVSGSRIEDGAFQLSIDHADIEFGTELIANALGVSSHGAMHGLLSQLIAAHSDGGAPNDLELDFALKTIAGITPHDDLKAMLAVQMVTVHTTAMNAMRRLRSAETIHQLEAHERAATKMLRTFTAQMEALRKHRSGGKQSVDVRHVHVSDGGQAIIGNVDAGGRGDREK